MPASTSIRRPTDTLALASLMGAPHAATDANEAKRAVERAAQQFRIYLERRQRLIVAPGTADSTALAATFARNLEALGYTMSPALFAVVRTLAPEALTALYQLVMPALRRATGGHRAFRPMYPDFPAQVLEASELELYLNALAHYFSAWVADRSGDPSVIWLPRYEATTRAPLTEPVRMRVLDLGSEEDFLQIFPRLAAANGSLSESDRAVLTWFVEARRADAVRLLPASIPQKETLALLVGAFLAPTGDPSAVIPHDALQAALRTATDVLRVAVALSGGDVSLAAPTRFRAFSRAERRFLLGALEAIAARGTPLAEDLRRWPGHWTRLGERLHPGEWGRRFPETSAAFAILRNTDARRAHPTFNGEVETALAAGRVADAVARLVGRPGEFARRLDHVLRLADPAAALGVVTAFLAVAPKVSTPVLLQLMQHFRSRQRTDQGAEPGARSPDGAMRAFFPKGAVAKMQVSQVPLPPLPGAVAARVAAGVRAVLVERFRSLPALGKVYLDPALRQQLVPFSQRSASRALRTVARGSRLPLPEANTLRFFLWWKDGAGRTDIDLSAVFYDAAWRKLGHVTYWDLRSWGCAHSGDITSAPRGACEFIDLDRERLRERGVAYVAMAVNSFTVQSFVELPECFAGWMARKAPDSGEVFEAKTVQDRVDLTADTTVVVPVVMDLVQGQVIWADLALRNFHAVNNVARNGRSLALLAQAIATLDKPTLYDLLELHVEARGQAVDTPAEAEFACGLTGDLTPFDIDRILSEFLA